MNFGEASAVISIYPSPNKGIITIDFTDLLPKAATVKIYDVLGQLVLSSSVSKNTRKYDLNLSKLPAAVNIISVNIDTASQTIRIIKQ